MVVEPFESSRTDDVVELSLRAWEPVFASLEDIMDPAVFQHFYPDWRTAQADAVRAACSDLDAWVAREGSRVAGFTALDVDPDEGVGEIHMIAVDPDFQGRGFGRELTKHALERFEALGLSVAMVETGGDPGHAPARRLYEGAGFRLLPVARYFREI